MASVDMLTNDFLNKQCSTHVGSYPVTTNSTKNPKVEGYLIHNRRYCNKIMSIAEIFVLTFILTMITNFQMY